MGRHSRLRLDLEAVVEDASNEVYTFQILKSLIYSKFVGGCTKSQTSTESYKNLTSYQNPSRGRIILRNPIILTLVKERFLSMLGSQIGPIEWTLVIRQVARQPLPRVIPEKTCVEVSHCYGLDQDNSISYFQRFTDGPTILSYDTLVTGLSLQSTHVDLWCFLWVHGLMDPSIYNGAIKQLPKSSY